MLGPVLAFAPRSSVRQEGILESGQIRKGVELAGKLSICQQWSRVCKVSTGLKPVFMGPLFLHTQVVLAHVDVVRLKPLLLGLSIKAGHRLLNVRGCYRKEG